MSRQSAGTRRDWQTLADNIVREVVVRTDDPARTAQSVGSWQRPLLSVAALGAAGERCHHPDSSVVTLRPSVCSGRISDQ